MDATRRTVHVQRLGRKPGALRPGASFGKGAAAGIRRRLRVASVRPEGRSLLLAALGGIAATGTGRLPRRAWVVRICVGGAALAVALLSASATTAWLRHDCILSESVSSREDSRHEQVERPGMISTSLPACRQKRMPVCAGASLSTARRGQHRPNTPHRPAADTQAERTNGRSMKRVRRPARHRCIGSGVCYRDIARAGGGPPNTDARPTTGTTIPIRFRILRCTQSPAPRRAADRCRRPLRDESEPGPRPSL